MLNFFRRLYMKFTGPQKWFHEKRFGMFVHWGIYSVGGVHEQELWRYNRYPSSVENDPEHFDINRWIEPQKKYEAYAKVFNPVKFDPVQWLDMAQENGFEYMTFTTKHHDGFCMWDTKETDFNIMNTPYGKDIFGMLTEECHKRDFPIVVYYSVVDWHQKCYPNLGGDHEIETDPKFHNMPEYAEYLKRQLRELCTNYGKINGIWWDINSRKWFDPSVNAMIRQLQPSVVINSRGFDPGDYEPLERRMANVLDPFPGPAEGCDAVGMSSWGYCADEDYFSVRKLERQTAFYVARGGNFLLNAGPKPDGTFDDKSLEILRRTGEWRNKVGDALRAEPCPGVMDLPDILCTGGGKELNLICLEPLSGDSLWLTGLNIKPEKVTLLNTGDEIDFTMKPSTYQLHFAPAVRLRHIPLDKIANEIPVFHFTFADDVIHAGMNREKDNDVMIL